MLSRWPKLGRIDLSLDKFSDSVYYGPGMRWSVYDDTLRILPRSQSVPAAVSLPKPLDDHQLLRDVAARYDGKQKVVSRSLD
jgi:hypothetical protein